MQKKITQLHSIIAMSPQLHNKSNSGPTQTLLVHTHTQTHTFCMICDSESWYVHPHPAAWCPPTTGRTPPIIPKRHSHSYSFSPAHINANWICDINFFPISINFRHSASFSVRSLGSLDWIKPLYVCCCCFSNHPTIQPTIGQLTNRFTPRFSASPPAAASSSWWTYGLSHHPSIACCAKKKKAEKPNEWAVVENTKLRTAETTTTNGGHTAAAAGGARHLKYKKDISRWRRRIVHCHAFAAGYIASWDSFLRFTSFVGVICVWTFLFMKCVVLCDGIGKRVVILKKFLRRVSLNKI